MRIDILVSNAGVETLVPFLELPEEDWDRILDVNLKGAYLCGQAAAREMARGGWPGVIINIASVNSEMALEGQAHYVSSKGGLLMLTKAMALDLAPHRIRVNAIGPGVIETKMTAMELAIVPAIWCSAQLAGVDSETAAVDQDVQRRLLLVLVEGDLTQLRLAPRDRGVIGHIIV